METNDYLIQISKSLGNIDAKLDSLTQTIAKHEARITTLEKNGAGTSFKDDMLKFMAKALIACIGIIAALTGSSALVTKILGGLQ